MNVKVKILNCNLGPLVSFVLCPESYKSVKLVSEKPMALEVEVNSKEKSGPILVVRMAGT